MLDKLKAVADRYEAIVSQLEDPAIYADSVRLAKLTREQKELTPLMEAYEAYRRAGADMTAAQEMMGDAELRELGQEEYQAAKDTLERLGEEIRILLRDKLVNYMQPKQVILLDAIPQNANGKIDRPAVMRLL